jgi:hypothetical protein
VAEKYEPRHRSVSLGYRNSAILDGQEDLSAWDDEELTRGQRRDKNGQFRGRPPKLVPKAIHDEMAKRAMSNAVALLGQNTFAAAAELIKIAEDQTVDPAVRIRAIAMILDRTLGKPTDRVSITTEQEPPWLAAVRESIIEIVSTDELEDIPAIDVESWEADDETG